MSKPGRRSGKPDTRNDILDAARTAFSEAGYDTTSIRHIAANAGVDASLVYHYFADKEELFAASIALPISPSEAIAQSVGKDPSRAGEALAGLFLSIWEREEPRAALIGMLRSAAGGNRHAIEAVESVFVSQITKQLEKVSPGNDVAMRSLGLVSQLIGMATLRYLIEIEPFASAPTDDIVDLLAPRLQSYITPV